MKKKRPKGHGALPDKPEYHEASKRNPFQQKMTGAGRAKKLRTVKKGALANLAATLKLKGGTSEPEIMEVAAARLAGIGADNPVAAFEFAASSYLDGLTRMTGNAIPVDSFWSQFLDLVKEADVAMAKTFARDFRLQFQWCLTGHIHRLKMEYDQLPTSVQTLEFYKKGGNQIVVARLRDGTAILLPDGGGYPRLDPCMVFAGMEERPPVAPSDFKRLEKMDRNRASALLNSGKFKFAVPDLELFTSDTVLNVAKPADLARIRREFSILALKPSRKK